MNKADLIAAVAERARIAKTDAASAIDGVFDVIAEALQQGDEVKLVDFGTFSVAESAARQGRNPRTGERIQIAASKRPKFKAGKGLKDRGGESGIPFPSPIQVAEYWGISTSPQRENRPQSTMSSCGTIVALTQRMALALSMASLMPCSLKGNRICMSA